MKKICVILLGLVMGMMLTVNAQAPYKHSVGVTVGSFEAFSYKTFLMDNLALSLDAGFNVWPWSIEVNPNLMYEAPTKAGGLHWLVGGGISLGYVATGYRAYYNAGKFGFNAIGGIEYKFNIPLTLQADFRPGFGMHFNRDYTMPFFDWSLCLGIRYTIN